MFIDTHSHIYEEEFREDRSAVIQRALDSDVKYIILPDIDSESRPRMIELSEQYPHMLFPLAGLHPTSVNENYQTELAYVEREVGIRNYYGIGECGIDLYWDKSFYKEQIKAFEHQLGIAKDMNFPIIIHARESLGIIFDILKKHTDSYGILHCFSGNSEEARQAIDMGFLLGIGGIVTFKKSNMGKTVQDIGIKNLVLETDSPYLAPEPYRGKRNESSYIPIIARKIADITGEDIKKIEETTTQNAMNLFNLHF